MRLLYVINGFDPGGAEHGLLTLVEQGFFDGHDLRVLAFCHGRGPLADRIRAALGDERVLIVNAGNRLSTRACVAGAWAVWQQFRRWEPDVAILSLKQANVIGRAVAVLFPSIRCVSFEHIERYQARRFGWVYQYLLYALSWRVEEIWADCQQTLDATGQYFTARARRHFVVPLFTAHDHHPVKTDYEQTGAFRVAAAGRLVARKNFARLIEAAAELAAHRTLYVDIFGDGPERAALQARIERCGLAECVHLHGYRPDWLEAATAADVFVNLSDNEGFCIVVAEAMSAGLPVVATNVGGIREYGIDRTNILTLPEADPGRVVATLDALSRDPGRRAALGRAARAHMRRLYEPEAFRQLGRKIFDRGEPTPGPYHDAATVRSV